MTSAEMNTLTLEEIKLQEAPVAVGTSTPMKSG